MARRLHTHRTGLGHGHVAWLGRRVAVGVSLLAGVACSGSPSPPPTPFVAINELVASNATGLQDASGAYPDWLELYNPNDEAVDLSAWTLTDDPTLPQKWSFPAGTDIEPLGYLIVFADADPSLIDELHASFRLSAGGEELNLVGPASDNLPVVDAVSWGPQSTDVAWARETDGDGPFSADPTPTPGASNE